MNDQRTTKANINKLIEFRQAVYEHGMTARRDALFNVLDALLCEGSVSSFAMLSRSEQFERKWPSLYASPPACVPHQRGRPRIHGERFAFKEPQTWGTPVEVIELEDDYWGRVRLERWSGLHEKKGADVTYEVIRACVHLERQQPPEALWLAWLPPIQLPTGMTLTVKILWQAYASRWPVEAGIHFRKETLGWTLPRFRSWEAGDRWTELTALACWMFFLVRAIVTDNPRPWQKAQSQLTPQRV